MKKKMNNITIVDFKITKSFIDGPCIVFTFLDSKNRLHCYRCPYYYIIFNDGTENENDKSYMCFGILYNTIHLSALDSKNILDLFGGSVAPKKPFGNLFNLFGS